jgi:hypothetical protein
MTNQKTDYQQESDHLRDMAVRATDRIKDAGERAQEMASEVAEQARQYGAPNRAAARSTCRNMLTSFASLRRASMRGALPVSGSQPWKLSKMTKRIEARVRGLFY